MPSLRRPRAVRPGATIALAAPAGPLDPEALDSGRKSLERLGFTVVTRDDVLDRDGYLAGSDARAALPGLSLLLTMPPPVPPTLGAACARKRPRRCCHDPIGPPVQ